MKKTFVSTCAALLASLTLVGCWTPLRNLTDQCRDALNTVCSPFTDVPPAPTAQDCRNFVPTIPDRMKCVADACKSDCERHDSDLCTLASAGVVAARAGVFDGPVGDEYASRYVGLASEVSGVERRTTAVAAGDAKRVSDDGTVKDKLKEECKKIKEWKTKCESKEPPVYIPLPKQCEGVVSVKAEAQLKQGGSGMAAW